MTISRLYNLVSHTSYRALYLIGVEYVPDHKRPALVGGLSVKCGMGNPFRASQDPA